MSTGTKTIALSSLAGVAAAATVLAAPAPNPGAATVAAGPARLTLLADGAYRTYELRSSAPLRGHTPPPPELTFVESPGRPTVRTGNLLFDGLYALAVHEAVLNSVSQIQDYAYRQNSPFPLAAFQTGEVWTYVWTRDLAYSTHLALAGFDPARAVTSLRFKSSATKAGISGGYPKQIVQDTGSGGSYPVSSDRVVWALGAEAVLQRLPAAERARFLPEAYALLHDTLEQDRRLIYDTDDGLYRGEQSFLDWREQTYPAWTKDDVLPIALSKALSVNVLTYFALGRAAEYAAELGYPADAQRYAAWAADLKTAINRRFYDPAAGLYSTYLLADGGPAVRVARYDLLGEALAILTGVASSQQAASILSRYPIGPHGPPVVWPQERRVPIYHNQAIWPFVTAYWLKAAHQVGNPAAIERGVAWLQQGAAENLSNMENFDFVTGRVEVRGGPREGPVVNSRRQLWSVAAYLSMVQDVVFGLETSPAGLRFRPGITAALRRDSFGDATVLEWRDLDYRGTRNRVRIHLPPVPVDATGLCSLGRVVLNGRSVGADYVPAATLAAANEWDIQLDAPGAAALPAPLRLVDVQDESAIFGPVAPEWDEARGALTVEQGLLALHFRHPDAAAVRFNIYRDGELRAAAWAGTDWVDPDSGDHRERLRYYAVEAVDPRSGNSSHLTRTRTWLGAHPRLTIAAAQLTSRGGRLIDGHHLAEWGRPGDTVETAAFRVPRSGRHLLRVEFANGAGPVNTGITCAVKQVEVVQAASGQIVASGHLVMPQSGDWQRWDLSSPVWVDLEAGEEYRIRLREDEVSRNMSYLEHNAAYTAWAGGGVESYNRVHLAALHLLEVAERPPR